jgi:transposase
LTAEHAGARRGGNKRTVDVREVVNGLMYILGTGCQWRAIPKDLPPRSTLHDYLELWEWDGTLAGIHHALYVKCREQVSREASPTAAIIYIRGKLGDRRPRPLCRNR